MFVFVPHSVSSMTTKLEGVCDQLSSVGAVPALILDVMVELSGEAIFLQHLYKPPSFFPQY